MSRKRRELESYCPWCGDVYSHPFLWSKDSPVAFMNSEGFAYHFDCPECALAFVHVSVGEDVFLEVVQRLEHQLGRHVHMAKMYTELIRYGGPYTSAQLKE